MKKQLRVTHHQPPLQSLTGRGVLEDPPSPRERKRVAMATPLFKETGVMEGACGKVLETGDRCVVIKKVHRHLKHRAKCLNVKRQCEIQQWASSLLTPTNSFSSLFTPKAWCNETDAVMHQYRMEKIDCSDQVDPRSLESSDMSELRRFYQKANEIDIFPCDYELYRQSDGRIALIDFDKFGSWYNHEVVFPWGLTWTKPLYPWD